VPLERAQRDDRVHPAGLAGLDAPRLRLVPMLRAATFCMVPTISRYTARSRPWHDRRAVLGARRPGP
jgi:hypothetical protein